MEQKHLNQGNIMAVDDNPANLKLLEGMLRGRGYQVRSFPRGRLALAAAMENPPELILLDISMPEMSGYEVCGRLKSESKLARIPVIFLSALDEIEDKVKAFGAGAVDFVTKPFQFEEVLARVQTHLALQRLELALQNHNDHLEELVGLRTRELAAANERLRILDRTKSDSLNLISHEFRTPLNGLLGIGDVILEELGHNLGSSELRGLFEDSRRRILTILDDALLLTQIETEGDTFAPVSVTLSSILSAAVERAAAFASSRQVTLGPVPADAGCVLGEQELLIKATQALLETAVKFSKAGETVRLACFPTQDSIEVVIESNGRAIPATAIATFFDLFAIGEAITPGGDMGLGPPVAHRILALFGASVVVENREPAGIRLTVRLRSA